MCASPRKDVSARDVCALVRSGVALQVQESLLLVELVVRRLGLGSVRVADAVSAAGLVGQERLVPELGEAQLLELRLDLVVVEGEVAIEIANQHPPEGRQQHTRRQTSQSAIELDQTTADQLHRCARPYRTALTDMVACRKSVTIEYSYLPLKTGPSAMIQ